jgi:hypothetical protein
MKHVTKIMAVILTVTFLNPGPVHALGLAARFGDVVIENARIGQTYNLREALKIPLGIENRSAVEVSVVVEFEKPNKKSLKASWEPIPDPSWLKSIPGELRIGPNAQGFFDLLLTIPDDPTLNGRHFQAIIKARTNGTGLFGVAIENNLRFSIGPGPETLKEEKRKKAMAQLDFNVSPQSLYVNDVPVGAAYDARTSQNKVIRVANYAVDPLPMKLSSDEWDVRLYKPADFEPIPDPKWITFKKAEQKIDPDQIASFNMIISIPNDPKYRGKKYAALIRTGLSTGFWLDSPVTVFITTKE